MHWRRKRGGGGGGKGGMCPPPFWLGGQWYVCAPPPPPLLTPYFYFPLELYVYITLTNNYLAFFIYQLIILWTISINWHRWMLLNNHTSKYNSFKLVLYRRYKNHVSVCPPLFGTLLRHCNVYNHAKIGDRCLDQPPPATDSGRTVRTPAKSGTWAGDRRALQQLALNAHVKHSDLTWPEEQFVLI